MIDEKHEQEVVLGSRIRIARNLAEFPFVDACSDDQRDQIHSTVRSGLTNDDELTQIACTDCAQLDALERQFLLDLQNVTQQLVSDIGLEIEGISTLDNLDPLSVQINEEDHLRITVTRNDGDLKAAWEQLNQVDDRIEEQLNYAFDSRWGYLTACPANVGTGMRASVLVHLPALALSGQIDKVFRSLQRIDINARGVFGESATGDFYRISNQSTLGSNESDLIDHVVEIIPALIEYELQAREFLLKENRDGVKRDVNNALRQLCMSDTQERDRESTQRMLTLLSKVRLGINMELIDRIDAKRVYCLMTLVHLRQKLASVIHHEDYTQAALLRDQISQFEEISESHGFDAADFAEEPTVEGFESETMAIDPFDIASEYDLDGHTDPDIEMPDGGEE